MKSYLLLILIIFSGIVPLMAQDSHDDHSVQTAPFIENKGQWDSDLLFRSDFRGGRFFLHNDRLRFGFLNQDDMEILNVLYHDRSERGKKLLDEHIVHGHIYSMNFVGANKQPEITKFEKQKEYHNYFIGDNPDKWAGNVGLYEKVLYHELWDGINLLIKKNDSNYEYDFIVKPGADVKLIKLKFTGQNKIEVINGQLVVTNSINTVIENAPYVYQRIDNKKAEIACNYVLQNGLVSFEFPNGYDPSYELIIDPIIKFSTFSGSFSNNYGFTATFDGLGNYYGGGIVSGSDYPVTDSAFQMTFGGSPWDVAITKYNSDGTARVYSTYLGGNGDDRPHSMIVDSQNRLIVYGSTSSSNFPIPPQPVIDNSFNGVFDIFITKFSSDGSSMLASTYVGGSGFDGRNEANLVSPNYGDSYRGEVMIDENNNIYVTSFTSSGNFPTLGGGQNSYGGGGQDACVFKATPNLSTMIWSSYLGGSGQDAGFSIKLTKNDEAIVSGGTSSTNFITTNGVIGPNNHGGVDGFVTNLNVLDGSVNQSTYIGTSAYDQAFFVEIDTTGDVFVYGQTQGAYPVSPDVYSNPNSSQFIHKMKPDLSETLLSTVFGTGSSSLDISPTAFLVDTCGNIYISGWGGGSGAVGSIATLPIVPFPQPDPFQDDSDGSGMYFAVFDEDMVNLEFSTFFGGYGGYGAHVDGGTSRFDSEGYIYQAICSCGGSGMYVSPNAVGPDNNSSCNLASVKMFISPDRVIADGEAKPNAYGCAPYVVDFESSSNGAQFLWEFGDGTESTLENPTHEYTEVGEYEVVFTAIDSTFCVIKDTTHLTVTVYPPSLLTADFTYDLDCESQTVTAISGASGLPGMTFEWNMGVGFTLYDDTVSMSYGSLGDYTITYTVTDTLCGIDSVITQDITISESISSGFNMFDADFNVVLDSSIVCEPFEISMENNSSSADYFWDFGDGSPIINDFEPTYTYDTAGFFTISLAVVDSSSCNIQDTTTMSLQVYPNNYLANFNYSTSCIDSMVTFINTGSTGLAGIVYLWDFGDGSPMDSSENPSHQYPEGLYDVTLVVYDSIIACADKDSVTINIDVKLLQEMDADFQLIGNCEDSSVVAFNTGTTGNDNVTYLWNMGDDSTYTEESFTHYYGQPGSYTITLQLTDVNCDSVVEVSEEIVLYPTIAADFEIQSGLGGCSPYEVQFLDLSSVTETSFYYWEFGNGLTSTEQFPMTTFSNPVFTTYDVKLTITDSESCNLTDSASLQIEVSPLIEVVFPEDSALCEGDILTLDAGNSGSNYLWIPNGETTQSIQVFEQNIYGVVVNNLYCEDSDSIIVSVNEHPSQVYSASGCPDPPLVFSALGNGSDYLWSTGQTTEYIEVNESGIYWNSYLDSNNCFRSDTIYVSIVDDTDQLFIPNSFSPNGDQINDTWRAHGGSENDFEVQVFDRWGKLMWESKNINDSWDGTYKGNLVSAGVYVYKLHFYSKCSDKTIDNSGTILVIR